MVVVLVLHLFFVDDMIVFANSHKQSILRFLGCLEHFEAVSSWLIETRVVLYCHGRHLSASQEKQDIWLGLTIIFWRPDYPFEVYSLLYTSLPTPDHVAP